MRRKASITPVGGWNGQPEVQLRPNAPPQVFQQVQQNQLLPRTSDACPSCFGTDWKAASLLYAEGISIQGGQTSGAFVAGGRAGGHNGAAIGGFQGRTSGVSQTLLSAKATPPRQSNAFAFFAFLFVVFLLICFLNLEYPGVAICFGLASGGCLMLSIKMHKQEQDRFESATERYATLRMCARCGTFFSGLKRA
jgi:hypothetical protein